MEGNHRLEVKIWGRLLLVIPENKRDDPEREMVCKRSSSGRLMRRRAGDSMAGEAVDGRGALILAAGYRQRRCAELV